MRKGKDMDFDPLFLKKQWVKFGKNLIRVDMMANLCHRNIPKWCNLTRSYQHLPTKFLRTNNQARLTICDIQRLFSSLCRAKGKIRDLFSSTHEPNLFHWHSSIRFNLISFNVKNSKTGPCQTQTTNYHQMKLRLWPQVERRLPALHLIHLDFSPVRAAGGV